MIEHDGLEHDTEKALLASELRLMGFSEYAVKRFLECPLQITYEIIKTYKKQADLFGDSFE